MKIGYSIIVLLCLSINAFGATFYLDPVNGSLSNNGTDSSPWSSLSEVINANYISTRAYSPLPYNASSQLISKNMGGLVLAGDTLVLKEGLHGEIFLRNYINDLPITVIAQEGHVPILERVQLQACENWTFEGVHVSSEPYGYYLNNRLFYIESHDWQGPSSNITVKNCQIYSSLAPWSTAQEWLDNVSSGVFVKADSCYIYGNTITNVDMGLTCLGDYIVAEENVITNFSGDGGRILGSHISFNYNLIKENFNVDDNHDDGIQSFTTNGNIVNDNEVIGNTIINTEDDTRLLLGPLQGIACFDGFYNDWFVANNVISVNHWHGITFLGANRCTIIHNTVIDPTPNIEPGGSWIRINDHKDGSPSSDCLVANNVANKYNVDGSEFSNVVLNTQEEYNNHFVDYSNYNFSLLAGSVLIDAADLNYSISYDHNNTSRDDMPDIGANEYVLTTSIGPQSYITESFVISPNPFRDIIFIDSLPLNSLITVFDVESKLVLRGSLEQINQRLQYFESGLYFFMVITDGTVKLSRAIKM